MQITVYILVVYILLVILAVLIRNTIMNKTNELSKYIGVLMGVIFISVLFMSFEMAVLEPSMKIVFNRMKFIGVVFIPVSSGVLYWRFLKKEKRYSVKAIILLLIVPIITLGVIATNSMTYIFALSDTVVYTKNGSFISFEPGIWFWIHSAYSYVILIASIGAMIVEYFKLPRIYRGQISSMLIGSFVGIFLNLLIIFNIIKNYGDFSIIAFAIAAIFHYWAIYKYNPEKMINISRSLAVDSLKEPVLIFNHLDQLINFNESAITKLEIAKEQLKQMNLKELATTVLGIKQDSMDEKEVHLRLSQEDKYYAISEKKIFDKNEIYIGRVITLNDITKIKKNINEMQFTITHDQFTGIFNRAAMQKEFRKINKTELLPISIIYFNICGMKFLSNVFGFEYGDSIIKIVANTLQEVTKDEGMCARVGGDEFAVLFTNCSEDKAEEYVNRINEKLKAYHNEYFIVLSYGIGVKKIISENIEMVFKSAMGKMSRNKILDSKTNDQAMFIFLEKYLSKSNYEVEGRIERCQEICKKISCKLGLTQKQKEDLNLLAIMHNVGLLSTSKEILDKVGNLSNDEWEELKLHVVKGYNIAASSKNTFSIANDILSHHERYDGLGYPNHLKGEKIPLLARIISAINYYDELVFNESAKDSKTVSQASQIMQGLSSSQFDPNIVEALLEVVSGE